MSLHTPRVALEKPTPHRPGDVHFVGISNEVDMRIERIALGSVKDRASRNIQTWIECCADNGVVTICLDTSIGKCQYDASTIFHHALASNDDHFIVTDGFDGKQDIYIPDEEIRSLARDILAAVPGSMGQINLAVNFSPVDLSVPF